MIETKNTCELAEKLQDAKTSEEYWLACLKAFDDLGVTGIGYGVVPFRSAFGSPNITREGFFRHTYNAEWERALGGQQLLDSDNTTRRIFEGEQEISWHENSEGKLDEAEQQVFELESDLGMTWGMSLALCHFSCDPVTVGIGLHVTGVRSDNDFEKYWLRYRDEIWTVAHMLNSGMLGEHTDAVVPLTKREKEYLYWSALGYDRSEIARRLGISEFTLDKPIASAKRKLKSQSTAQAVAKAVLLKIIQP
jgi:DNA-binding CsgD family transcriptional regulator